jgi:ribosomal protein L20
VCAECCRVHGANWCKDLPKHVIHTTMQRHAKDEVQKTEQIMTKQRQAEESRFRELWSYLRKEVQLSAIDQTRLYQKRKELGFYF